jgi:hypothetical protein
LASSLTCKNLNSCSVYQFGCYLAINVIEYGRIFGDLGAQKNPAISGEISHDYLRRKNEG